jgi:hypothetical protein
MELTIRTSEGQVQLQGSEKCKTELVDKYRDSLTCERMELLEANRL